MRVLVFALNWLLVKTNYSERNGVCSETVEQFCLAVTSEFSTPIKVELIQAIKSSH